jgi:vitamin B12 transporter
VAPGPRSAFGVPAAVSHTRLDRDNARLSALLHLPARTDLTVGAEHQHEDGLNSTRYSLFGSIIPVDFELGRTTDSEFVEIGNRTVEHLFLHAGVRFDSVSGSGSQTSPSAGARYDFTATGTSLKADLSEGFKPPSFFALGLPVPLGGNPNLRAEHSKTGSAGIEQKLWSGRGLAGLSLFKTRYHDLVDFDNTTNALVNRSDVTVQGGELEFTWRLLDTLDLRAHYTRLTTHVADTEGQLRQRPGKRAGIAIEYRSDDRLSLSWSTEYVADVFDSSIPTGDLMLPSLVNSDMALRYRCARRMTATVAVDNLFDRHYEQFVGFANPGRRARALLSWEM